MERYQNTSGASGVRAYEIGKDSITVEFADGGTYLYNARSTGKAHIAEMQRLAPTGHGLATYINQHVRGRYARRLR